MPVQACIPVDLFGDALMVLEYLHCFGEMVDYKMQFPNGISLGVCVCVCVLLV